MARVVELSEAGAQYLERAEIVAIVWVGASSAGDSIILKEVGGGRLWEGKASSTFTYQGIQFPESDPLLAPGGVEFESYSSGTVYLYLKSK